MQHCMATVWKNQRVNMIGSTETCFDTIKVLDVVRQASDDDFMEQWAVGCTGMPSAERQLCKDLIRTNMQEVSMLLKSDLTARQIAGALKLCGGFADTVPHHELVKMTGDYCKDCVNFMGDLREIFKNSEEQAESLLKGLVCSKTGPLESLCDQLVDQYGQMILNMVYQRLDPQAVCEAVQMCANQTHANVVKDLKYLLAQRQRSAAECDVCKSLTGDVQSALKDPALQNDITSALENDVCPLLGGFAGQCKTLVADYAPVAFQVVVAYLDPQTLCQTLGLCNATKSDSNKLIHVPLVASSVGAVQIKAPKDKANSFECTVCKSVVDEVKKKIAEGKKSEEILENLCNDLPDWMRGECTTFVEKYGPMIINYVMQEMDSDKICELMSMCPDAALQQAAKSGMALKKSSEECTVCLMVMKYVQQAMNSSEAKTFEKEILDKACANLPDTYKSMCESLVAVYWPTIANLIEEEVDPNKICSYVGLCGNSVTPSESQTLKFLPMMKLRPAAKRPLLGRNKCLFGPSFWCASEENARLCNTVDHCRRMKNKVDF